MECAACAAVEVQQPELHLRAILATYHSVIKLSISPRISRSFPEPPQKATLVAQPSGGFGLFVYCVCYWFGADRAIFLLGQYLSLRKPDLSENSIEGSCVRKLCALAGRNVKYCSLMWS